MSIYTVAARAGVSIKTVSRVINGEPVRESTKRRVDRAVEALGYRPNKLARNLATGWANTVALFYGGAIGQWPEHIPSYLSDVEFGALRACSELHYSLVVSCRLADDPDYVETLLKIIQEGRIRGVVLAPLLADSAELLDALDQAGIRYARISPANPSRGGLVVQVEEVRAAYEATLHLIEHGHRRIAMIKGPPKHGASELRLQGFRAAHADRGLQVDEDLIVAGDFRFDSGKDCASRLLFGSARPTAIFASNDEMAAGCLHVANSMQLRVPLDLSVVGFDDSLPARYVWPSLTTMRQPIQEMAAAATRALIASVREAGEGEQEEPSARLGPFRCELIIRHSTGPAPRS